VFSQPQGGVGRARLKAVTVARAENVWIDYMATNSISRAPSKKTGFAFLPVLTGLFTATLLISNVLNCKVIRVGRLPFTGGLIMFPLAALFGDVLTEVYGYAESRKVIWTALGSLVLFVIMIEICGALPADSLWTHQGAYDVILGAVPRIVAASLTAYFVGESAIRTSRCRRPEICDQERTAVERPWGVQQDIRRPRQRGRRISC
jgi:hypothetical protein